MFDNFEACSTTASLISDQCAQTHYTMSSTGDEITTGVPDTNLMTLPIPKTSVKRKSENDLRGLTVKKQKSDVPQPRIRRAFKDETDRQELSKDCLVIGSKGDHLQKPVECSPYGTSKSEVPSLATEQMIEPDPDSKACEVEEIADILAEIRVTRKTSKKPGWVKRVVKMPDHVPPGSWECCVCRGVLLEAAEVCHCVSHRRCWDCIVKPRVSNCIRDTGAVV